MLMVFYKDKERIEIIVRVRIVLKLKYGVGEWKSREWVGEWKEGKVRNEREIIRIKYL